MESLSNKRHRVTVRPAHSGVLWDRLWEWLLSAPEEAVGEDPLRDEKLKEPDSEIDPRENNVE